MKSKMLISYFVGLLLLLTFVPAVTHAFPQRQEINYQGVLTDSTGNPVPDGDYDMVLAIYDSLIGGTPLFSESQTVPVINGQYGVVLCLDCNIPLPPQFFEQDLYLGITVENDEEMTPRLKITSTAFAFQAQEAINADTLDGLDSTDFSEITHSHSFSQITGTASDPQIPNDITVNYAAGAGNADTVDGQHASAFAGTSHNHSGSDITSGTVADARIAGSLARDSEIMPTVFANDGPGSGLNADLLDGLSSSSFLSTSNDYGRSGVASNLYEGTSTLTSRYLNDDRAETIQANTTADLLSVIQNGTGIAIDAQSEGTFGIRSYCNGTNGAGVAGYDTTSGGSGVFGQGASNGVYGYSITNNGNGVMGEATGSSGIGVYSEASGTYGRAFEGRATGTTHTNHGGYFFAAGPSGRGAFGEASGVSGTGVKGRATATGASVENYGGYFEADGGSGYGVYSESVYCGILGKQIYSTGTGFGVAGTTESGSGIGVFGDATSTATNYYHYGVFGRHDAGAGYAGYFHGPGYFNGYLTKAGGGFQIDHPLEPENKYLNHSFVESPDMMNIYNGNVVLNNKGEAWIELPDWFEALNKDFRYQLTCIGGFAKIYIAEEISNNRFMIAGGTPGMKVSWQVTGIRQDAWAEANRTVVEVDKPEQEQGSYLHPELFGMTEEQSVEWARNPEMMQELKKKKEMSLESKEPSEG